VHDAIRLGALAVLLASAVATSTRASALDEVLSAHASGGDAAALATIQPLAEHGDATAEFKLGVMYSRGWAFVQSYAQAKAWYEKAASQDFAPAEVALGALYNNPFAGPRDLQKTAYWWGKAADQGDPMAQANLANLRVLMSSIRPGAAQKTQQAAQVDAGQLQWDRVPTATEMDALFPPLGAQKQTLLTATLRCAAMEDGTLGNCAVAAESPVDIGVAHASIQAAKLCRFRLTDQLRGEIKGSGLFVRISFTWKPPALSQQ